MPKIVYTPEIHEFIVANVVGVKNKDLARMVNEKFGTNITVDAIVTYKYVNGLKSGLDFYSFCRKKGDAPNATSFKKGHVPANKGKKGIHYAGCEKSWFKKGHVPKNHKPVGSERIDSKDGYVLIKVAEPNKYVLKHRWIWEQAYGPIPKNHNIIFLDGNKQNICLENLKMVSRREQLVMNRKGLFFDNRETTSAGHNIAKLLVGVAQAEEAIRKGEKAVKE